MLLTMIQVFLLVLFAMAGMMKNMVPKEKFDKKMPWAKDYSASELKTIGRFEVLGALGVTLPMWLGILPWLTPLAAIGLLIITLFALKLHVSRKENGSAVFVLVNIVLIVYVLSQTISLF